MQFRPGRRTGDASPDPAGATDEQPHPRSGNRARYRIKDFAAFYLARILGKPIAFHEEFARRDREIATLAAAFDAQR